jgi:hypothetical protein
LATARVRALETPKRGALRRRHGTEQQRVHQGAPDLPGPRGRGQRLPHTITAHERKGVWREALLDRVPNGTARRSPRRGPNGLGCSVLISRNRVQPFARAMPVGLAALSGCRGAANPSRWQARWLAPPGVAAPNKAMRRMRPAERSRGGERAPPAARHMAEVRQGQAALQFSQMARKPVANAHVYRGKLCLC